MAQCQNRTIEKGCHLDARLTHKPMRCFGCISHTSNPNMEGDAVPTETHQRHLGSQEAVAALLCTNPVALYATIIAMIGRRSALGSPSSRMFVFEASFVCTVARMRCSRRRISAAPIDAFNWNTSPACWNARVTSALNARQHTVASVNTTPCE